MATKEELEAELAHANKALEKAEKARLEAEEMADAALEGEKEANARARAAEAGVVVAPSKPATEPVTGADIKSQHVRAAHAKAKEKSGKYADSEAGRRQLAQAAQDHLIALRDLDVAYAGHGVSLHVGGDLFVGPKGAHPRTVGAMLAQTLDVATLAALVDELTNALQYEGS